MAQNSSAEKHNCPRCAHKTLLNVHQQQSSVPISTDGNSIPDLRKFIKNLDTFWELVKGHNRTGSDSKAFIEATKRDALLLLESELRKLVDSAPAPEKERTRIEFNGFTELFKRFLEESGPSVDWDKIEKLPPDAVRDYASLQTPTADLLHQMLNKLVVVKLNGGLGTSMGCYGPKSVIVVRNELTFLDLTVQQIEHLNKTYKVNVPLVLMNSFNTNEDTEQVIRKYKNLNVEIHTFNQSCHPRISRDSLMPIAKNCDVEKNMEAWYPPGHGDFYESFYNSGLLTKFVKEGRDYCFISNIDNLGATVDVNILNLLMNSNEKEHEFVMEVTDKTRADVKGGTLIQYENTLRLLEIAQVPKEHVEDFKSVKTFKFFNTNNLWIKLPAIERIIHENALKLEIIVNGKSLSNGVNVIQLETAVGAAMKCFNEAIGVNVPRSRFLPVKKTSDLLLVMSNLYSLKSGSLVMSPQRMFPTTPLVKLGDNHFSKVKEFLQRFANIPDLLELDHLTVSGDVTFGKGVGLKVRCARKMDLAKKLLNISYLRRKNIFKICYSTIKLPKNDISKIRNIGISAHIDAGKTTTTERMLYYSGFIDNMGEVHHGNTFTDFMEQERERGITITSAAVTFFWKNHQFNLIDTPGHIDFTMEVEQTLNVLDGVVVILDGSAGVEAQTLTVWRQADRYNIPRIIYVNKMDRSDADIHMCCASIEKKLDMAPILLQLPAVKDDKLMGVVDVLSLELMQYGGSKDKNVSKIELTEKTHPKLFEEASQARVSVIERLSDYNDELANKVISSESFDSIPSTDIFRALQKVTQERVAVPVVLGSSYKNIGVQTLMDAVILYLPSPEVTAKVFSAFEDNFCGRAFKVKHDKQRGPLVFARIYNGTLKKGQKIFSVQKGETEPIGRMYVAYADDFKEVNSLGNGNIAVLSGLKKIMSGDLITSSQTAYERAKKNVTKKLKPSESDETLFGVSAKIPEPVFFCSIEPPSMATQTVLDQALAELQREDPSLRVSYNSETGQTVLAGMGELHLEIIRDRILKEYKLEADLGPLQIAYREAPIQEATDTLSIETKIGSIKNSVLIKLSVIPVESCGSEDVLKFDRSAESASNISAIFPKHMVAIRQGIEVGLAHGPKISSQIINAHIMLHWFEAGRGTSDTIIASTVTQLIQKILKESGSCILEPVMLLEVVSSPEHLSAVLSDLSRRRTSIGNVTVRGNAKVVTAIAPLSELLGYSTDLRTLTSGTATFSTEFYQYQKMSSAEEDNAIRSVRGF